ncbi:MAG: hypothetical protein ACF8LL_11275, partial [Phycisphaerales bacterium]
VRRCFDAMEPGGDDEGAFAACCVTQVDRDVGRCALRARARCGFREVGRSERLVERDIDVHRTRRARMGSVQEFKHTLREIRCMEVEVGGCLYVI